MTLDVWIARGWDYKLPVEQTTPAGDDVLSKPLEAALIDSAGPASDTSAWLTRDGTLVPVNTSCRGCRKRLHSGGGRRLVDDDDDEAVGVLQDHTGVVCGRTNPSPVV
jgi:hypothetical protein